jgi:hypothetical protein
VTQIQGPLSRAALWLSREGTGESTVPASFYETVADRRRVRPAFNHRWVASRRRVREGSLNVCAVNRPFTRGVHEVADGGQSAPWTRRSCCPALCTTRRHRPIQVGSCVAFTRPRRCAVVNPLFSGHPCQVPESFHETATSKRTSPKHALFQLSQDRAAPRCLDFAFTRPRDAPKSQISKWEVGFAYPSCFSRNGDAVAKPVSSRSGTQPTPPESPKSTS